MKQTPPQVLKQVETRDDIEREVAEQVRRIQRYNWKLNQGIGNKETNFSNIRDAFRLIDELTKEGAVSGELQQKVEGYRQKLAI